MTPSQIELSRRLVAAQGWSWADGAANQAGDRWNAEHKTFSRVFIEPDGRVWASARPVVFSDIPDLNDAATVGCIARQAQEVWSARGLVVWVEPWAVRPGVVEFWPNGESPDLASFGDGGIKTEGLEGSYPTEGEAWAALRLATLKGVR
jgi:hypothetical protein